MIPHVYEVPRIGKLEEIENRLEDTRWWGEERREEVLLLNGYRISIWSDEKSLEMDSGDGCKILWIYLMSLNCTLKFSSNISFMLPVFYHNKEKERISYQLYSYWPKPKKPRVFISRGVGEQTVICSHNAILLDNKMEQNINKKSKNTMQSKSSLPWTV